MNDIKKIEKEIEDALIGVLRQNGITEISKIYITKNARKMPFRAGALGNGQKLSDLPSHEVILQKLTIRLLYAEPEKS